MSCIGLVRIVLGGMGSSDCAVDAGERDQARREFSIVVQRTMRSLQEEASSALKTLSSSAYTRLPPEATRSMLIPSPCVA